MAFWVIPQQENLGSIMPVILGLGIFLGLLAWSARDAGRLPPLLTAHAVQGGIP
jgi:hypothetical protein